MAKNCQRRFHGRTGGQSNMLMSLKMHIYVCIEILTFSGSQWQLRHTETKGKQVLKYCSHADERTGSEGPGPL